MRLSLLQTLLVGMAWVAGCTTTGVVKRLPEPIFPTWKPNPSPVPPPAPPRAVTKAVPAPQPVAPKSESGWMPPGGISRRWSCIVIHHSASASGGAASFDQNHRAVRKWDELGYHFVIGNGTHTRDGQVEVGSRWTKQKHGAHCKTADNYYNDHGIGICLVGDFSRKPPSSAQMASLAKLVQFLAAETRISPSRIFTHGGVTNRTACPGAKFSLTSLKGRLNLVSANPGRAG